MKKFILIIYFIYLYGQGFTQILQVVDQESGQALEFVTISSDDPQVFTTTDTQGKADITAFKSSQKIEIRLTGFKTLNYSYHNLLKGDLIVKLSPDPITLNQLVISATRWSQTEQELPNKISTISAKDIALQNPQTAADLLGASGEVFIQKSQQGGGSPMIRGFSANRLLYSVDGIRMNTAIFRSGNLQNVISLDPFTMENTEVLFGPGSVIYGSDAIGGVMSFQTLSPRLSSSDLLEVKGKAMSRYATANHEISGHFDINLGWEKWALLTSISINRYDDLRMGRNGQRIICALHMCVA